MLKIFEELNKIKAEKAAKIKPENLKTGVTAFGVEGALSGMLETDYTSAIALTNDILKGGSTPSEVITIVDGDFIRISDVSYNLGYNRDFLPGSAPRYIDKFGFKLVGVDGLNDMSPVELSYSYGESEYGACYYGKFGDLYLLNDNNYNKVENNAAYYDGYDGAGLYKVRMDGMSMMGTWVKASQTEINAQLDKIRGKVFKAVSGSSTTDKTTALLAFQSLFEIKGQAGLTGLNSYGVANYVDNYTSTFINAVKSVLAARISNGTISTSKITNIPASACKNIFLMNSNKEDVLAGHNIINACLIYTTGSTKMDGTTYYYATPHLCITTDADVTRLDGYVAVESRFVNDVGFRTAYNGLLTTTYNGYNVLIGACNNLLGSGKSSATEALNGVSSSMDAFVNSNNFYITSVDW